MGLSSALATAMSGLRANQAALSIVSGNVANAQTPGYVTQTPNQIEVATGTSGTSVDVTGVSRQLDLYVQSQLRTETAGSGYADQMSNILGQLQSVYGTPGGTGTLETSFSNFTTAVQALSTNSGSQSAQTAVLTSAQSLTSELNQTTLGIQSLRTNVEQDIGTSVTQANTYLTQIATINTQLQGLSPTDPAAATLENQRDSAVNQLSSLMDVKAVTNGNNQIDVFTNSGIQLVGAGQASQMTFNSPGALTANSLYNSDPTKSGVGSLSIRLPNGASMDMVANNVITSGKIAADLNLRDTTLVQAQSQVDAMAASMSNAVSNQTTAGAPVTGPPAGFSLNVANVLPGNTVNLTYTDSATNTPHQLSIVNVTDPAALPLQNSPNANPKLVGIDFSGTAGSIVSQLNNALSGSHLSFSLSGSTLQVTDDGTTQATVNAASATTTASSLTGGSPQLPLFTDGSSLYTGAITSGGSQMTGHAGRITVNAAIPNNPQNLTVYSTSPLTQPGDTTRSSFLYSQLTSSTSSYSPQTGLGSASAPYTGTITGFMQQFLSQQSNAATNATQLQQGQDVIVSTLQQKFNSVAGVSIDTEMSNLIALQNSYAANAHVMSVVQSMMNSLLQAQV